jgi:hypothetical protein
MWENKIALEFTNVEMQHIKGYFLKDILQSYLDEGFELIVELIPKFKN